MNVFEHADFDHESLSFISDERVGMKAIIAVHNRTLGPAIGGCRMLAYASEHDALTDVLRLSRGMTYKCAIAGIPYGGGKAVIIGDPADIKTDALLEAFGSAVDGLNGRYITSFDSGTNLQDLAIIRRTTAHVGGVRPGAGNASESTAYGVFQCMKRACDIAFGATSVSGRRVTIQGAGNVGARLAKLVSQEGGLVSIFDTNVSLAREVADACGGVALTGRALLGVACDIFSPCALGGVLTEAFVERLDARIVCGGANNQLADLSVANLLKSRGVLYCPDYLVNAGGIVDLHHQMNMPSRHGLAAHLDTLADTLQRVHARSEGQSVSMAQAANGVAEGVFSSVAVVGSGQIT